MEEPCALVGSRVLHALPLFLFHSNDIFIDTISHHVVDIPLGTYKGDFSQREL